MHFACCVFVTAQDVSQGEPWTAALAGHTVDPVKQQEEQQRLMLERFQEEVYSCTHRYVTVSVWPGLSAAIITFAPHTGE